MAKKQSHERILLIEHTGLKRVEYLIAIQPESGQLAPSSDLPDQVYHTSTLIRSNALQQLTLPTSPRLLACTRFLQTHRIVSQGALPWKRIAMNLLQSPSWYKTSTIILEEPSQQEVRRLTYYDNLEQFYNQGDELGTLIETKPDDSTSQYITRICHQNKLGAKKTGKDLVTQYLTFKIYKCSPSKAIR